MGNPPNHDDYIALDGEFFKRAADFVRKNAKGDKPFFITLWPQITSFLGFPDRITASGGLLQEALARMDTSIGSLTQVLEEAGVAENTLVILMADNGPMVHNGPPGMVETLYTGGKGDYTEGGVRVPAIAWWPGVIEPGQLVGDTNSRRDYVHIYTGPELAATVKGRYKKHWTGAKPGLSGPEFYDLYNDPREANGQLLPMFPAKGMFNVMKTRHLLMKEKYPDKGQNRDFPLKGIENARPETIEASKSRVLSGDAPFEPRDVIDNLPEWDNVDRGWGLSQ